MSPSERYWGIHYITQLLDNSIGIILYKRVTQCMKYPTFVGFEKSWHTQCNLIHHVQRGYFSGSKLWPKVINDCIYDSKLGSLIPILKPMTTSKLFHCLSKDYTHNWIYCHKLQSPIFFILVLQEQWGLHGMSAKLIKPFLWRVANWLGKI